jgi:hypothetical protein
LRLDILAELKSERDRLDRAISALEGGNGRRGPRHRGVTLAEAPTGIRRRRRHMSAAARRKISEMMKKRWAERKKSKAA